MEAGKSQKEARRQREVPQINWEAVADAAPGGSIGSCRGVESVEEVRMCLETAVVAAVVVAVPRPLGLVGELGRAFAVAQA